MYYILALTVTFILLFGILYLTKKRQERAEIAAHFHIHYFLAGVILSFYFPGDLAKPVTTMLGPVLMFCISWAGMYYGFHLEARSKENSMPRVSAAAHILAPFIFLIVFALVGIIHSVLLRKSLAHTDAIFIVAAFSSISLYAFHSGDTGTRSVMHSIAADIPPFRNLAPLILLTIGGGLLYGHSEIGLLGIQVEGPAFFIFAHVFTGALLGIICSMLIKGAKKSSAVSTILIGICALVGGIADTLLLSPLLIGLIVGSFTINATLKRHELLTTLTEMNGSIEKILSIALGILFVIVFQFNDLNIPYIVFGAIGIALLRFAVSYIYLRLTAHQMRGHGKGMIYLWAGFSGQGAIAIAAALEYRLRIPHTPAVFAVLILSLFISQFAVQISALKLSTERGV